MNNNLRFPISDIAQEIYQGFVNFAKSANTNFENSTIIEESNKYDLRFNNYEKYHKKENDRINTGFYSTFHNITSKGHSIILTFNEFKFKRLSFSGEHMQMRKQGYEYFCYPFKKNNAFIFISPSGAVKFNHGNKTYWLSISNVNKFPFNIIGIDVTKLLPKLLFNNKKNEWCENHIFIEKIDNFKVIKQNNFTKTLYGDCSNLQQFINRIKTIDEPLSYKQFIDLTFDDMYMIMSLAPVFKNPINFIDNYKEFIKIRVNNHNYITYFDDLLKIANETNNKVNFSLNETNIKEQHDRMLLENIDKMKAKTIHVDDKFLVIEKYLPSNFKMIKDGKELLFESLTQKHCVNSYANQINDGTCCILTCDYNDRKYTAEIKYGKDWFKNDNKDKYTINQFKGYANISTPKALENELINIIDTINEKELKIKNNKGTFDKPFDEMVVEYIDNSF